MDRLVIVAAAGLAFAGCSRPVALLPADGCVACHGEMTGFVPGHDPAVIGCASCHLGRPDARTAPAAHAGMVRIPGNLDNASATCSTVGCHPGIDWRVKASLMNTMRGVVSVDRFAFGEQPTPDGDTAIQDIGQSPADTHLRNLCASCHLGAGKKVAGPVTEFSRGGGCTACHLNYPHEALRSYAKGGFPAVHPQLSLQVGNEHCFGCHSRSGRISTNYEGWHETLLQPRQAAGRSDLRLLDDQRVFRFIAADLHHTAGLDCIDCHDGMEIMGDGQAHAHQEDAVTIACDDCHRTGPPQSRPWAELLPDEQRMVRLRAQPQDGQFLVRQASGRALTNVRLDPDGTPILLTKNHGEPHPLRPPAAACSRGTVHDALACSACHTAWTPQCISCHSTYRPEQPGYDLLDNADTPGSWEESPAHFLAGPPTLGVRELADGRREIIPFVPGMILDLALPASAALHRRLFAPTEAHTTTRQGRGCADCHLDPVALGYGRGALAFSDGKWSFTPSYPNHPADGLPLDAWIGFREAPLDRRSTRTNTRPFNPDEQTAILRAGTCLTCHEPTSSAMLQSLSGLAPLLPRMSPACRAP